MNEPLQSPASTVLTRAELYALIWAEPMTKIAERFGISGPQLAKVCSEHDIPRPDQGHWTRLGLGLPVVVHALEPPRETVADRIEIVRRPARQARKRSPEAASAGTLTNSPEVPEKLVRPHPLVAEWIAQREREVKAKDMIYDRRLKRLVTPAPLSAADRRRLRVANALFKAVEARGVAVSKGERFSLQMSRGNERIEFQLRYRMTRGRRPLDAAELRWQQPGAPDWRYELYETDSLVFEIKTWLPRGLRTEWEDSKRGTIEEQLGDIIDGILAAFPALEERRREGEEAKRRRDQEAQERYLREEERKLDRARFRKLLELAGNWREAEVARAFVAALRAALPTGSPAIGGIETDQWIAWAERKIEAYDRLASEPGSVLEAIAAVTSTTYRDI